MTTQKLPIIKTKSNAIYAAIYSALAFLSLISVLLFGVFGGLNSVLLPCGLFMWFVFLAYTRFKKSVLNTFTYNQ
jgi:F0F1-type ATP synthase assembly protein I